MCLSEREIERVCATKDGEIEKERKRERGRECVREREEAEGTRYTGFQDLCLKAKALTMLCVPYSPDSGRPYRSVLESPFI